MTISWKKFIFRINEYYSQGIVRETTKQADLHAYFQQKKYSSNIQPFTIHRQTLTLCIDLKRTVELLRKELSRTTRYEINRAKHDNFTIKCIDNPDIYDIEEFVRSYKPFEVQKNIHTCKEDKLKSAMENNMLVITSVYHQNGRKLASHAIITNKGLAIGLYSYSGRFANKDISKQCVSRANRHLHWQDILLFKRLGYHTFDFMGLSIDPNDLSHQNINKFKKGFGGVETIKYQCFIPQNFKGILLIFLLKFLWRNNKEVIRNGQMPVTDYLASVNNQGK